jgi:hypothetical protein
MRLAISKGPNSVSVPIPSREEGNIRSVVFSRHLEFLTIDEVDNLTDSKLQDVYTIREMTYFTFFGYIFERNSRNTKSMRVTNGMKPK